MANANLVADGQKTRFKPGVSGNPKGRPKGRFNLATAVQEMLADEKLADKILKEKPYYWDDLPTKDFGHAIIYALALKVVLDGDVKAFSALYKAGGYDKAMPEEELPPEPVYFIDLRPRNKPASL